MGSLSSTESQTPVDFDHEGDDDVDLFDVVRSCARRWYVFIPLLAIVSWISYSTYNAAQTVYYSNAVIGLAAPSSRIDNAVQGIPVPRNGLLDVGGASLIANMTALGLSEPAVIEKVVASGGIPDYNARMFPSPANMQQLPLVMIEATDADEEAVSLTIQLVSAQAEETLRTLQQQAQVPEAQMVRPFVVSPPSTPYGVMPSRARSTISIFVAGAGLTVVATVLLDVLLCRIRRRRETAHGSTSMTGGHSAGTPSTNGQPSGGAEVNEHDRDTSERFRVGDTRPD